MSNTHRGNIENQILIEEHDGDNNAKRVNVVAGGVGQATVTHLGLVTLAPSPNFIGLVTATGTFSFGGNVTLNPSPNFIGITTVANKDRTITGNVTLSDSKGFIGLVTVGNRVDLRSNVTLNTGPNQIGSVTVSNPVSIAGNLTLSDPKGFIGLTTTVIGSSPSVQAFGQFLPSPQSIASGGLGPVLLDQFGRVQTVNVGNVTVEQGDNPWVSSIVGNVTITDGKTFIGLITVGNRVDLNSNITLNASPNFIGIVTVTNKDRTITGNLTLSDSKGFIGLTTTVIGSSPSVQSFGQFFPAPQSIASGGLGPVLLDQFGRVQSVIVGNVTVEQADDPWNVAVKGNVTLSDSKSFVGLVTVGGIGTLTLADPKGFIGLVTVVQSNSARTITGNLTLSDAKTFIGLVTAVPAYGSNSTVYTGVISATGNTTVLTPPSSQRFFIKNLHISSLGRSEAEIRSGATTLIPFTSLSTTSGYFEHYGEMGLPARAQNDALVINLNGAATISYMANLRFEA